MKTLTVLTFICFFALYGCKKGTEQRTITVTVTNVPANTTYSITAKNATHNNDPLITVINGDKNALFSCVSNSGDVLNVQYNFSTPGQQFGAGNLDFVCNGQNLLHANGGFGTNFIIKIP